MTTAKILLCIALALCLGCGTISTTSGTALGPAPGVSPSPTPVPAATPSPTPTPTPSPSPTPVAGTFTLASGSLAAPRLNHTATLLKDGTVLVAGGFSNDFNCAALNTCFINNAEQYSAASGRFAAVANMIEPRNQHTATRLPDGQVLIVGGNNSTGFLATTELFDTAAGAFKSSGSMAQGRRQHTATLLASGKVLIAGGSAADSSGNKSIAEAELYDPAAGTFSRAGTMSTARTDHTASLLSDGKVLIVGGNVPCSLTLCGTVLNAFSTAELYDPGANLFSSTGSLATARFQHTATVLPSGLVVIAGGQTTDAAHTGYVTASSIEIYDPASGNFSPGGSLLAGRASHTATLLGNGQILFTGGIDATGVPLKSAELYTPAVHASSAVSDMVVPRVLHTATALEDGEVIIIGGGSGSAVLTSAEIFK